MLWDVHACHAVSYRSHSALPILCWIHSIGILLWPSCHCYCYTGASEVLLHANCIVLPFSDLAGEFGRWSPLDDTPWQFHRTIRTVILSYIHVSEILLQAAVNGTEFLTPFPELTLVYSLSFCCCCSGYCCTSQLLLLLTWLLLPKIVCYYYYYYAIIGNKMYQIYGDNTGWYPVCRISWSICN